MKINKYAWKKCVTKVWAPKVQKTTKRILEQNKTINYNVIYIHYIEFTQYNTTTYQISFLSNNLSSVYLCLWVA